MGQSIHPTYRQTNMINRLLRILIMLAVALAALPLSTVGAQSGANFSAQKVDSHFPEGLTFSVNARSSASQITAARLYYRWRGDPDFRSAEVEIAAPGYAQSLDFSLLTLNTLPPGAELTSYWKVTLADGSTAQSDQITTHYDDLHYDWKTLENEQIAVMWHDRRQAIGEQVFDIARMAVNSQSKTFGAKLDYQMRIVIYNSFDEFAAWHNTIGEFIGGQAFPDFGITAQILPDEAHQNWWQYEVIPHEIAHLYFYQVAFHPDVFPPMWLNEGVAQYSEFTEHGGELSYVEDKIWDGGLVPLADLPFGFDVEEEEVLRQSYAESLSAVTYLVETYGTEGLSALLAAYKSGKDTPQAFPAALGVTLDEFQADWLIWMGVPPELYPSPTPKATTFVYPTVDFAYKTPAPTTAPTHPAASPTAPAPANLPARSPLPGVSLSLLCALAGAFALLAALGLVLALSLIKK